MGAYIFITKDDQHAMRAAGGYEVNELLQEALKYDKTVMISERIETTRGNFLFGRKVKEVSHYTIYHEVVVSDGSAYQARVQMSGSGSKEVVIAYLTGIINGALAERENNKSKNS